MTVGDDACKALNLTENQLTPMQLPGTAIAQNASLFNLNGLLLKTTKLDPLKSLHYNNKLKTERIFAWKMSHPQTSSDMKSILRDKVERFCFYGSFPFMTEQNTEAHSGYVVGKVYSGYMDLFQYMETYVRHQSDAIKQSIFYAILQNTAVILKVLYDTLGFNHNDLFARNLLVNAASFDVVLIDFDWATVFNFDILGEQKNIQDSLLKQLYFPKFVKSQEHTSDVFMSVHREYSLHFYNNKHNGRASPSVDMAMLCTDINNWFKTNSQTPPQVLEDLRSLGYDLTKMFRSGGSKTIKKTRKTTKNARTASPSRVGRK